MDNEIKCVFDELFCVSHDYHKKFQEKLRNKTGVHHKPFNDLRSSVALGYKLEVHRAAAMLKRDLLQIMG